MSRCIRRRDQQTGVHSPAWRVYADAIPLACGYRRRRLVSMTALAIQPFMLSRWQEVERKLDERVCTALERVVTRRGALSCIELAEEPR